ncbi:MAG: VanZ family protein [Clostridiales bacterium]|nr:VanZ family protein [Clostridiales bacterium]
MKRSSKAFTTAVFAVYMILLVWLVMFKLETDISLLSRYRRVLLIPFCRPGSSSLRFEAGEMLLNLFAFMPLGYWLAMLDFPKKPWARTLAAFCLSLLLETLQYLFFLGTSDVTDLILNTLGAVLGGLAFKGAKRLMGERAEKVSNAAGLCVMLFLTAAWAFLNLMN